MRFTLSGSVNAHLSVLTLMVLLPVLVLSGVGIIKLSNAGREQYRQQGLQAVRGVETDLDRELAGIRITLQVLATAESLQTGDLARFYRQAMEVVRQEDLHVVLRDRDGQQLVNTRVPFGTPLPKANVPTADDRVLATGRPIISDLFIGAVSKEPLVMVIVPVRRAGEIVYLLNMSIPVKVIGDLLDRQPLDAAWTTVVMDSRGRVIARTRSTAQFAGRSLHPEQRRVLEGNPNGWYRLPNLDDQESYLTFLHFPEAGWMVAAEVPVAVVDATVNALWGRMAMVAVGSVLVSLLLAFLFGRRIAVPLVALERMAIQVGGGQTFTPPQSSVTEIARVSAELGRAAAQLAARRRELEDLTNSLERKVANRTRALADTADSLQKSERRFRAIFDSAFQFIGLLSPEGILLEVNQTALTFGGLTADEVIGKPFWEARWWPTDALTQTRLREAIRSAANGTFVRYEVEVRGAGDQRAVIDFSLKPLFGPSRQVELLVPEGRDISALKRAQAQLFQAQKMESLGQLTGGIAHDFNNLLQAIANSLAVIRARAAAQADEVRPYLDTAQQAIERGASLTRQLVAFARRQELAPKATDLTALLPGMIRLLERTMGGLYRIECQPSPGTWPALTDATQLELALLNLAINARDAMPNGGSLTIRTRNVMVAADDTAGDHPVGVSPGHYAVISVTDTGTGMTEEVRSRAFDPFFTTKETSKGSGLGLSIVHGMTSQLGGGVQIHSSPGHGTTVELYLPRAIGLLASATDRSEPHPVAPAARILLVDDEPLVRIAMIAALESLGHTVLEATSPGAALEQLRRDPSIDALLTDYAMPQMTGIELIRSARSQRPDLPVLLMTGHDEAVELPEVQVLRKPFRPERLAATLAQILKTPASQAGDDRGNVVALPTRRMVD